MFNNNDTRSYQTGDLFLGLDENGYKIGISTDRHAITIAGSRSGKGAGLIIPNLKRWPDNVLVIDPKGENAELTYQDREAMGQAVHVLDPFESADIPDRIRAKFNPLTSIDLTSNRARATIADIANGLVVVTNPKHMEWTTGARRLLAGIIAYVLVDAPQEHHSFATVRQILMQPTSLPAQGDEPQGLYADAQIMAQDTRMGGLIRSAGVTIMTAIESSKGMEKDFLGLAQQATEWLDDESISACLSDSTFQMSDLKTSNASIYLVLPSDGTFLETYGAFLRLFVKTALNAMGSQQQGKRCLFILDEFYSLGKLEELVDATGRMPSYGVHLWPFMQNLTQLYERYGRDGAETFFGNADAHIFFGNSDRTTLKYVSEQIGNYLPNELAKAPPIRTSTDWTQAKDAGFWETEKQYVERKTVEDDNAQREYRHKQALAGSPRLPPDQVKALVAKMDDDSVAGSMIVFGKGRDVFNLKLAPYFETQEEQEDKKEVIRLPQPAQDDPWIMATISLSTLGGFFGFVVLPFLFGISPFFGALIGVIIAIAFLLYERAENRK